MGALFKTLLGGATSFVGGAQYWLIAIAVATVASGAFGYYEGSDHVTKEVINASDAQIASASAIATKAQADKDSKDFASTKADYETEMVKKRLKELGYM